MNKYITLAVLVAFLALSTMLAGSLSMTTTDIVQDLPPGPSIIKILPYINVFWAIITFQIEGLPVWITLLVFWPLTISVLYMTIDIIRGTG